jgi:hypothetical protein
MTELSILQHCVPFSNGNKLFFYHELLTSVENHSRPQDPLKTANIQSFDIKNPSKVVLKMLHKSLFKIAAQLVMSTVHVSVITVHY